MKNKLLTYLSLLVVIGILAACGSNDATAPNKEVKETEETKNDTETQVNEGTEAHTEENTETIGEEKTVDNNGETTAEKSGEKTADVANAIDFTEALDRNKPVPLGEYMRASIYATETKKHHTVYIKLNKITSETEDAAYVQKAIHENNAEGYDFDQIDRAALDLPSDIELNVIDYEIFVPKEFPAPDYGLAGVRASFYAKDIVDGGTPSNDGNAVYLGLGVSEELLTKGAREQGKTFAPGNAYPLRAYFMMVKGYDDYVIELNTYPDGSDGSSTSDMHKAYFAIQ